MFGETVARDSSIQYPIVILCLALDEKFGTNLETFLNPTIEFGCIFQPTARCFSTEYQGQYVCKNDFLKRRDGRID